MKLMLVVVILIAADRGIGYLLSELYFQQRSGLNAKSIYSIREADEDIIIMGASKVYRNYDPQIFEDSLGMSCYNAGRNGQSIIYNLAVQECILKRHEPKMFILDINPQEFLEYPQHYERLNVLLPFYNGHEEVRRFIHKRSNIRSRFAEKLSDEKKRKFYYKNNRRFEKIKLLSAIYPYNSTLMTSVNNIMQENKTFKGYFPHKKSLSDERYQMLLKNNPIESLKYTRSVGGDSLDYDQFKIDCLHKFVDNARSRNIEVRIVTSPILYPYFEHEVFNQLFSTMKPYGDIYWNYFTFESEYRDPKMYFDLFHMNYKGAEKFSRELAGRIKRELNTK